MMDITKATDLLNERMHIMESINSLKDLVTDDAEMTKLMNAEELTYKTKLTEIDNKLMQRILEHLGNESYKNVILMISAGVGGQEAMLFVKDLYNMYIGYLEYLGLNYEIMELDKTEQGGLRIVNIIITGDKALVKLKYEGGVHRVQRIPSTEKSGRIHTSTVSVAILPEPANIEIHLDEKNLKIETKRASGPGGQHVNTTDSAVRVTHLPSGISVNCQIARTQHKNREWAISKIKSILYEQELNKQTSFLGSLRKKQMGLGLRNEKIRTYNYVQDRVTDHRLENGTVHNLPTFMMGGAALEKLEDRLHEDMQKKILMDILKMSEMQLK
ncbi:hypothetical protein KM043_010324 [Ampulex compressa]|nr:hypothetical protein KM043_010324 [Ampulex compressa]